MDSGYDDPIQFWDNFLVVFSDLFSTVFDFVYKIIFVDSFSGLSSIGIKIFNTLYPKLSVSISTGEFIFSLFGIIVFIPLLKITVNLIRG